MCGSKIAADSPVQPAALTKLRRADTNTASVAKFVDFVEQVHDVETDLEGSLFRDLDPTGQVDVECLVGMVFLRVGKTATYPVAIQSVNPCAPIFPGIGNTGRTGETLIVIEEDPVFSDVIELIAIEEKLRRAHVRAACPSVSGVQIGGEPTFVI